MAKFLFSRLGLTLGFGLATAFCIYASIVTPEIPTIFGILVSIGMFILVGLMIVPSVAELYKEEK